MTFKGMLKILINDFKKQYDEKMFSIADELKRTRLELHDVKEQLHTLQVASPLASTDALSIPASTLSLFVRDNRFFNELCAIHPTITIKDLLIKVRQIIGIPLHRSIHLRVLSEDGLTTLFFLDDDLDRTLESYEDQLKAGMILSIEYEDEIDRARDSFQRWKNATSGDRRYSHESDV